MSTPVWKKRLILIIGLLENLIFSGTILGWSALNYMLKSEGVYSYICDDFKPQIKEFNEFNNSETIERKMILKRNSEESDNKMINKLKALNKEFVDFMLTEVQTNDTNMTFLDQLESYQIEPSFSPIYKPEGCGAQDKILNLAFTIGSFCMGFTAFVWGFLLEKWGLKIVRLLISCLITGGTVLLCLVNSERPYLIFPAVTLLCLGGVPLRIANMQFANLYPSRRSTIISLYSGAFCASAVVFVGFKYLFDAGMSYFMVSFLLVIISLFMFPFTLLILPSDRIREDSEPEESNPKMKSLFRRNAFRSSLSAITPVTLEKFTFVSSPDFTRKLMSFNENEKNIKSLNENNIDLNLNNSNNYYNNNKNNPIFWIKDQNTPNVIDNQPVVAVKSSPPLKISLCSLAFNVHQWWFSWLITYMILYVGSLNLWLKRVTNDIQSASNFAKIYGCAQVVALVLAPIAGYIMDQSIQKADKETDPFDRKLKRVRAGFWPLFLTTIFLSVCLLCRFYDTEAAIYSSIVFMTIFRAFLVAVGTAYLRIRFSGEHFNRLLGIMSTTASVVSLLQFPLFVWESQYPNTAFWINIFNCFCTLIAFTNPLHILINPLQKYLLHKEERQEADAKSK